MNQYVVKAFVGGVCGLGLFLGWWWFWLPALVWYAIYANAWWLVLLAIVIDGYYGAFYTIPYQTMVVFVLVAGIEVLRPHAFINS